MDWNKRINIRFKSLIQGMDIAVPFKQSLLTHPTAQKFKESLAQEISKAERVVHKRRGKKLKLSTVDETIDDLVKFWVLGLKKKADERIESEISKKQREAELQYQKDLEATADGKPQGIFEGLDISYGDTREENIEKGKG